jgi:hypothetical protein
MSEHSTQSDAKDMKLVATRAHARRKFEEALKALPKGKRSPTAEQGVAYCTKLFELEKAYEGLTFEKRKQQRLDRSKPVLDVILTDCEPSAAGHIRRGGAA